MKLSPVTAESRPAGGRLSTTIFWEDSARAPREVWFDVEGIDPEALRDRADAFLPACAIVAMRDGERRIAVEGPVCPRLRDGLTVATTILREWHGPPRLTPSIETSSVFAPPIPALEHREALLFTGGVGSLHSLWRNRRTIPKDHPASYRDLLWVEGLSSPGTASPEIRCVLGEIAAETGCRLVVGSTNLRELAPELLFYYRELFGALLSGFGHALSGTLTALSFSSAWDLDFGVRVASHPLLDPFFESSALAVRHEGAQISRLEKMREMSAWSFVWSRLAVCDFPPAGEVNCGRCEKCRRMRLQLEVTGLAGSARTLPSELVSPEEIASLSLDFLIDYFWKPLAPELRKIGRTAAAEAVEERVRDARRRQEWINGQDARGRLRRLDRRYFGGALWAFSRRVRRRKASIA